MLLLQSRVSIYRVGNVNLIILLRLPAHQYRVARAWLRGTIDVILNATLATHHIA